MATTYNLEYDETLVLMLFSSVQNIEEIKNKLSHLTPPFSHCTMLNYKLILDPFQVLVAGNKAVVSKHSNALITKSLSTELLFNLSISDNITASLNKFGYSTNDQHLLLAVFDRGPEAISTIVGEVQGNLEPITHLCNYYDIEAVKKSYEVAESHLIHSSLLNLIVTKIACKGL